MKFTKVKSFRNPKTKKYVVVGFFKNMKSRIIAHKPKDKADKIIAKMKSLNFYFKQTKL